MKSPHLSLHAERAIRLEHAHFGVPCLRIVEAPAHVILAPAVVVSIHGASENDGPGMDRLIRAVAAFNAIMSESDVAAVPEAPELEVAA